MKIIQTKLDNVRPNDYNPNSMDEEKMALLQKVIESHDYLQPIVVRKDKNGDGYIIVDGEHRWAVMKDIPRFQNEELVFIEVDCDDDVAKLQTINFNLLRGEMDSIKVATIIHEQLGLKGIEELTKLLGMTQDTILTYDSLVTSFNPAIFDNSDSANVLANGADAFSDDIITNLKIDMNDAENILWENVMALVPEEVDSTKAKDCFIWACNQVVDRSSEEE